MADQASIDGAGLVGRPLNGDEKLHSGGDETSVCIAADLPFDELHDDITPAVTLERAVDGRDPDGGGNGALDSLRDVLLCSRLGHSDGPTVLDPRIGGAVFGLID